MSYFNTPHPMELRVRAILLRAESIIASVAMVMMVTAIGLQVSARFLFEKALTWTDEVAIFSFVWVAMVGAAIVIETRGAHLIDYFVKKFSIPIQRVINVLIYMILMGTLGVLIVYGIDITAVVDNQVSSVMGLRMSFVYGAMPFAATLMVISLAFDWRLYLNAPTSANEGDA